MNPLTKKFLAYARNAKANPKPAPAPEQPKGKPLYPIEGFISEDETVLDRQGRLTEALAKGYYLSPENWCWFKVRLTRKFYGNIRHQNQYFLDRDNKNLWRAFHGTQPTIGGFR